MNTDLLALAEALIRQVRTGFIEVAVSWWHYGGVEQIVDEAIEQAGKGMTVTNMGKAKIIKTVLAEIQNNEDANFAYDYEAVKALCEYHVNKTFNNPVSYREVI